MTKRKPPPHVVGHYLAWSGWHGGFGTGAVHAVQVIDYGFGPDPRVETLCGRDGRGYVRANKAAVRAAEDADVPTFADQPSATDLPTCGKCLGSWRGMLERAENHDSDST